MLKNMREYLTQELHDIVNNIKESQKKVDDMKETKAEAQALVDASDLYSKSKTDTVCNCVLGLLLGSFFALFASLWIVPSTLPFMGVLSIIGVGFITQRVIDIKKLQTAKKLYNNLRSNAHKFNPDDYEDTYRLNIDLCLKLRNQIENYEDAIGHNKKYLEALWDILSSDDFINSLEHYSNEYSEEIKDAITQEWYAYIDELSQEDPSKISFAAPLPSEDYYKKVEFPPTEVKVLEKNPHPLAIYQPNDDIN